MTMAKRSKNPDVELSEDEEDLLVLLDKLELKGLDLTEVKIPLLNGEPYFVYSLYEETTTFDEETEDADTETEWLVEDEPATLDDILGEQRSHYIQARHQSDLTEWWESEPEQDYRDGSWTRYAMFVILPGHEKHERLPPELFEFINVKLGGKPRKGNPYLGDAVQAASTRSKKQREKERQKKYGYPTPPRGNPPGCQCGNPRARRAMNPRNY